VEALEAAHLCGQGGTWGRGFGENFVEVAPEREACDAFGTALHLNEHRYWCCLSGGVLGNLHALDGIRRQDNRLTKRHLPDS